MRLPRPLSPRPLGLERRAFSLLELIVALAVLSLAATIAVPSHFGRADVTLRNAAELLVEDVAIARRLAIGSGAPIELHLAQDGYFVTSIRGELLRHPRTGSTFRRAYNRDAVFRGVRIYRIAAVDDRVIRFGPTGESSGTNKVHLMFRGNRREVLFDHASGKPTVVAPDE
ncbi:MAG: prepilin-type N-terminal cleavage/methylation domain-containing protein [Planctomycetota bacterium]